MVAKVTGGRTLPSRISCARKTAATFSSASFRPNGALAAGRGRAPVVRPPVDIERAEQPTGWDLIATLDDATSEIYAATFVGQEGTMSSLAALAEVIGRSSAASSSRMSF